LDPIEFTEIDSARNPDATRIGTVREKNPLFLPLWGSRSKLTFILLTIIPCMKFHSLFYLPFSCFISPPATSLILLYQFLPFRILILFSFTLPVSTWFSAIVPCHWTYLSPSLTSRFFHLFQLEHYSWTTHCKIVYLHFFQCGMLDCVFFYSDIWLNISAYLSPLNIVYPVTSLQPVIISLQHVPIWKLHSSGNEVLYIQGRPGCLAPLRTACPCKRKARSSVKFQAHLLHSFTHLLKKTDTKWQQLSPPLSKASTSVYIYSQKRQHPSR
jgi:hypothetical protein